MFLDEGLYGPEAVKGRHWTRVGGVESGEDNEREGMDNAESDLVMVCEFGVCYSGLHLGGEGVKLGELRRSVRTEAGGSLNET